jgi:predicted N-acyltransferase
MIRQFQAHTIDNLDPERWDAVRGDLLPMSYSWLRAMEASHRFFAPRYVLLEDGWGPCAAIVVNTSMKTLGGAGLFSRIYHLLNMIVAPPFSVACGIAVRPGVQLQSMTSHINHAIDELRREEKRFMTSVIGITAGDLSCWADQGFIFARQQGTCTLDLSATYEAYLRTLRHKNRAELRRIRRRAGEMGVRLEHSTLAGEGERVFPLFREVFARHGVDDESVPFTASLFEHLDRELPERAFLLKGFVGNELVGASLCVHNGLELWWPMAGLHYQQARPAYIYFLLIDEMIRWSIQNRIRRIHGGLTNEREKRQHGFYVQERWLGCHTSWPLANKMLALAMPLGRWLWGAGIQAYSQREETSAG